MPDGPAPPPPNSVPESEMEPLAPLGLSDLLRFCTGRLHVLPCGSPLQLYLADAKNNYFVIIATDQNATSELRNLAVYVLTHIL